MDYTKLSTELLYLSHCLKEDSSGINDMKGILGIVSGSRSARLSGFRSVIEYIKRILRIVSDGKSEKPPRAIIFIHCDEIADFSDFTGEGIHINSDMGSVRTAILPISEIDRLSEYEGVISLEASTIMKPCMDVALSDAHLPIKRGDKSLTGKGVIIGIIDTGIDAAHEAFKGRILRIWDQENLTDNGVEEGRYGKEFINEMNFTDSLDDHGHGTHVAGIAGGRHSAFGGVAPDAKFVIVKTTFNSVHIEAAIRYIFRVAKNHDGGRPAVINLSLGSHLDAHDGSDTLSEVINKEAGKGKIICVAAGNEGSDPIHAQVLVPQDHEEAIIFNIAREPSTQLPEIGETPNTNFVLANPNKRSVCLTGWHSEQDTFEITLKSPAGLSIQWQGILEGDQKKRKSDDQSIVVVTTSDARSANRKKSFLVTIRPKASDNPETIHGNWTINIRGATVKNGNLDMWLVDESAKVDGKFVSGHGQISKTVSSPGWADKAITVGAFTTKLKWDDMSHKLVDGTHFDRDIGEESSRLKHPSKFSSRGSLNSGIFKPDVCAPGEFICAPLSSKSECEESYTVNGQPNYRMMRGTSMATPFISGIVAQLLQEDRELTPSAIKRKLKNASRIPGKVTGTYDPKWGFGLIDATLL